VGVRTHGLDRIEHAGWPGSKLAQFLERVAEELQRTGSSALTGKHIKIESPRRLQLPSCSIVGTRLTQPAEGAQPGRRGRPAWPLRKAEALGRRAAVAAGLGLQGARLASPRSRRHQPRAPGRHPPSSLSTLGAAPPR